MTAKRGRRMGKVAATMLATSLAWSFVSSLPAMAAGDGHGRSHQAEAVADSTGDWLAEIDRYRAATDLAPVSDNPSWDAGLQAHLIYLEKTPRSTSQGSTSRSTPRTRQARTTRPQAPLRLATATWSGAGRVVLLWQSIGGYGRPFMQSGCCAPSLHRWR
jgi:hypothetical protein